MAVNWSYGIVAFLDVLGFSAFIEEDCALETPRHLERLLSSLREVRESASGGTCQVRAFSDSIVISAPLSLASCADVLGAVVALQQAVIARTVLVRGGIAFGKHYSDQEAMYSEALVRAYRLEREHARFPRVVVSEDLLDWIFNHSDLPPDLRDKADGHLLRDRDGLAFVNYLTASMLPGHRAMIQGYERRQFSASVLEKLQWLASYHNFVAEGVDSNERIGGDLVAGFRSFGSAVSHRGQA